MSARVIDLETEKARRLRPAHFGQISNHEPGLVTLDLTGRFTPAAARVLGQAILELADAAEREGRR